MPDVEVVGAADPSQVARARAREHHGFPCFANVGQLLEKTELDVLCVLSPVSTHRAVVEAAAGHGVAVLCEKPLALTLEDASAMVERCAQAGVALTYGSSYRYLGSVTTARQLILSGAIGEVSLIVETLLGGSGPGSQQPIGPDHYPLGSPGGSGMGLVDHGIHFIDVAPWLVDRAVAAAFGRGNRSGEPLRPEFMVLELDGGLLAHFLCFDGTWSTTLPNEGQWLDGAGWDVSGTYLSAGLWGRDLVEIHVFGSSGALRIVPYGHKLYRSGPGGMRGIPVEGPSPPHHFGLQLRAVIDALWENRPMPVPGESGVVALRVLLSVYSQEQDGNSPLGLAIAPTSGQIGG
jgi:UDP-N-acetyl-2-amino-2-deoxyglucuronate dehydrogenase